MWTGKSSLSIKSDRAKPFRSSIPALSQLIFAPLQGPKLSVALHLSKLFGASCQKILVSLTWSRMMTNFLRGWSRWSTGSSASCNASPSPLSLLGFLFSFPIEFVFFASESIALLLSGLSLWWSCLSSQWVASGRDFHTLGALKRIEGRKFRSKTLSHLGRSSLFDNSKPRLARATCLT